jgi:P-type Ca2+ transporter type 2C
MRSPWGALLVLAGKAGIFKAELEEQMPRLSEFAFSAERKRMSVVVANPEPGEFPYVMFTKGSPELILERCDYLAWTKPNHQQIKADSQSITQQKKQQILESNAHLASTGLRVLGFAYKFLSEIPAANTEEENEQGLTWLGLVGMLDAPREEAKQAVQNCRQSGIRPMMITGDHPLTARAIATKLNIAHGDEQVISGQEIARMSARY